MTRDHSLLQEQIDSGLITAEQAKNAQHKNLVTKALGIDPTVEPEIHEYPTKPGDIYLLCSDGLCDMVEDDDIGMTLQALGGNLKLAAQQLVQMANDNGGRDNVSVILVRVLREYPGPRGVMAKVFAMVKISSPGISYGETDTQHGWAGAQGDPLGQGAHHHRPQAAQRHPDRQPRGERRARGHRHHPQRFASSRTSAAPTARWSTATPIKKHFLQNNDIIELGKYKLKFVGEAPAAGAAPAGEKADFEKTMVLRPSQMKAAAEQAKAMAAPRAAAPPARRPPPSRSAAARAPCRHAEQTAHRHRQRRRTAAAPAPAVARAGRGHRHRSGQSRGQPMGAIQLLSGANAGKELELNKPLTTLGKPGVQVAVLTRRPQGYFITHVEGPSRPAVNGQQIGAAPHALKDHDVIELAGVKMEFFIKA